MKSFLTDEVVSQTNVTTHRGEEQAGENSPLSYYKWDEYCNQLAGVDPTVTIRIPHSTIVNSQLLFTPLKRALEVTISSNAIVQSAAFGDGENQDWRSILTESFRITHVLKLKREELVTLRNMCNSLLPLTR